MSSTDNLQKKVLSTNALKTNFISNTTQKLNPSEKRFSHISKEKQTQLQLKHTVHKNTARYYEQIDMQGSATILPQKNSSRKNIYMNQNSNLPLHVPSNQRKESNQGLILNNLKGKSPIDKNRIHSNNIPLISNVNNTTASHIAGPSVNTMTINNKFTNTLNNVNMQQMIPTQSQIMPSIKNQSNRINEDLTDREKHHRNTKQQHTKQHNINKMKIAFNRKHSAQINDLICDQQMEMNFVPQKQHTRKPSYNLTNKNQTKTTLIIDQYETFTDQNYKTQKKHPIQKSTIEYMEKTKSQHNICPKQFDNNPLISNNISLKSISHLMINENHTNTNNFQFTNRQQQKLQMNLHNYEQELRKFTHSQTQLNMNAEIQTILRLQNRQTNYLVQPNYIECKQKNFNWSMRAVLMDWMAHVCYQFGLKRETYYIAVSLADKFLQKTNDLPKSDFQLVGAASMFIAAKLQEFQALSSGDFSKSTDNRYSPLQIKQMQLKICRCMNYELNPPTLYMWANRFMANWDSYIQLTNARYHPYFQNKSIKYFKKQSQQSYLLFREMMQFLDCSILDVQTLQFAPKILVCSFIYLVLGKNYKQWPLKRIVDQFPRTSHYLLEQDEIDSFNNLFHMFISQSFQLDLIELLPSIQYCSTYFTLPLNFEAPSYALKTQSSDQKQLSLEDYESYQTYNGKMIDLIKKRYRGVYP